MMTFPIQKMRLRNHDFSDRRAVISEIERMDIHNERGHLISWMIIDVSVMMIIEER
jgi:hypothetical protein